MSASRVPRAAAVWIIAVRVLTPVAAVVIALFSLIPSHDVLGSTGLDKLDHLIAYAVLSFLVRASLGSASHRAVAGGAAGCLLFGLLLEGVQHLVGRDMELVDALFNGAGIVIGLSVYALALAVVRKHIFGSTST